MEEKSQIEVSDLIEDFVVDVDKDILQECKW